MFSVVKLGELKIVGHDLIPYLESHAALSVTYFENVSSATKGTKYKRILMISLIQSSFLEKNLLYFYISSK